MDRCEQHVVLLQSDIDKSIISQSQADDELGKVIPNEEVILRN